MSSTDESARSKTRDVWINKLRTQSRKLIEDLWKAENDLNNNDLNYKLYAVIYLTAIFDLLQNLEDKCDEIRREMLIKN